MSGCIYGRLTDAQIYSAMLNVDVDCFVGLAAELADALMRGRIEYVVGDAMEGYNPAHDVCRLVINAAARKVCRARHCIENFQIVLTTPPGDPSTAGSDVAIEVDEQTLLEKLRAARNYSELTADIDTILEKEGMNALRVESLRRVTEERSDLIEERPYYEQYGRQQVAAGYYERVIRYREHILPIAGALEQFVGGREK